MVHTSYSENLVSKVSPWYELRFQSECWSFLYYWQLPYHLTYGIKYRPQNLIPPVKHQRRMTGHDEPPIITDIKSYQI